MKINKSNKLFLLLAALALVSLTLHFLLPGHDIVTTTEAGTECSAGCQFYEQPPPDQTLVTGQVGFHETAIIRPYEAVALTVTKGFHSRAPPSA